MNKILQRMEEIKKLEIAAFHAINAFWYYKENCPKECKRKCRVKTIKTLQHYESLRACFDNYKDKETLKNDIIIKKALLCFNISTF